MRKILNISLPPETAEEIHQAVKSGKYASASEYVRAALRVYSEEINIRRDNREKRADKEFKKKKLVMIRSIKDLGL